MTIRSLKYVIEIVKYNSLSLAAQALYISQSTLSVAVHELEQELGIKLFVRTNRGVSLTQEGEDFLPYARNLVEESDALVMRYSERRALPAKLSVTSQKFAFATRAFVQLEKYATSDRYVFSMCEETAARVVQDVADGVSDLGVMALPESKMPALLKMLASRALQFVEISRLPVIVFLRKTHPLAAEPYLTVEHLMPYTYATYRREVAGPDLPEDFTFDAPFPRRVLVADRSTLISLIRNTECFAIHADLPNSRFAYAGNTGVEIVAVPFKDSNGPLVAGYIKKIDHPMDSFARIYLKYLEEEILKLKDMDRYYNTVSPIEAP